MNKTMIFLFVLMLLVPFSSFAGYNLVYDSNQCKVELEGGDTLLVYTFPIKQGEVVFVHHKVVPLSVRDYYVFKGIKDNNIILEVNSAHTDNDDAIRKDVRSVSTETLYPFQSLPRKTAFVYVQDVKIKLKVMDEDEILAEVVE
ncbi:MAG: hypothetical protein JW869_03770 [Candidatus Omnitrophica bacterium]|nr:hypothetical protein [Candidatus Omnitrophota bacterium]